MRWARGLRGLGDRVRLWWGRNRALYRLPRVRVGELFVVLAVAGVLVACADGPAALGADRLGRADLDLTRTVLGTPDAEHGLLERAAQFVTIAFTFGPSTLMLFACFVTGYLCRDPRLSRFTLTMLGGALAQVVTTELIKDIAGRLRPTDVLEVFGGQWMDVWAPLGSGTLVKPGTSFPSGHAAFGVLFAVIGSAYWPRYRWQWWCVGLALPLSRWVLNRHYLSDLWVGGCVGAYIGMVALLAHPPVPAWVVRRMRARHREWSFGRRERAA